jgi:hypothetical protein
VGDELKRDWSSAAARARWLAEVAAALDEAMILVERLGGHVHDRNARIELLDRIEAARQRTRLLRLRHRPSIAVEPPPKWSGWPANAGNGESCVD